jgi:copper chaperone
MTDLVFDLPDLSCGHCVAAVTRAVAAVDPAATVQADVALHRATVTGATVPPEVLAAALTGAGYPPRGR